MPQHSLLANFFLTEGKIRHYSHRVTTSKMFRECYVVSRCLRQRLERSYQMPIGTEAAGAIIHPR